MIKFLWDINIEDITCGWETAYQNALKECPKGKTIEMVSCDYYGTETYEVDYNPVQCRNILVNAFNELKLEANELYSNLHSLDFKPTINKLLRIDILLFSILSEWTFDGSDCDASCYDPSHCLEVTTNIATSSYFENLEPEFDKFKLINLELHP